MNKTATTFNVLFIMFSIYLVFHEVTGFVRGHRPKNFETNFEKFSAHLMDSGGEIAPYGEKHLAIFKKFLPEDAEAVSFISDRPWERFHKVTINYRVAVVYFAPLYVNRDPGEKYALVICANNDIANKRLKELGYKWHKKFPQPGFGIAVKVEP